MLHAWHYLNRPRADGPHDVLDVKATVDLTAQQGFFLYPVYQPAERNGADLLLIVDRNGSMVPFHRFTHELIETAHDGGIFRRIDIVYIHNVPTERVYRDPYLTMPVAVEQTLAGCTQQTSALVISDAGAARGHRRLERIRATALFLSRLKQCTSLIAWLNPMPEERWPRTSAQIIAHMVPMFPMQPDGMFGAVDAIRRQASHHAD